jgi:hypothetical protein
MGLALVMETGVVTRRRLAVMRRPFAPVLVLAALTSLAALPAPVAASSIAKFRLTDTDLPGAPPVSTVLMSIVPPGAVQPLDPSLSPLKVLDGSTGFNPDDLTVRLGDGTTPSGGQFQALKLDFGPNGFQPGGRLYFSLNLSPSFSGVLSLILPASVTNLSIESLPDNFGGGGGVNTPEPVSIVLWSSVAGLGLLRARAYRRAHARAAAALA